MKWTVLGQPHQTDLGHSYRIFFSRKYEKKFINTRLNRIEKDTNTNTNVKKRGILWLLSAPCRYVKSKIVGAYKKLVKKFQIFLKIKTIWKLNFHEVENFQEVKCTPLLRMPVNVL